MLTKEEQPENGDSPYEVAEIVVTLNGMNIDVILVQFLNAQIPTLMLGVASLPSIVTLESPVQP